MRSARPPLDGATVLITGASAGLGRALATLLAARAGALVLAARRRDRLETLAADLRGARPGLRVDVAPCDLADPDAAAALADRALGAHPGGVDVLVNNAGVGDQALYDRARWPRVERLLRVNVLAPALLTHRLLPGMVARGRGGVLNVGSGAGFAVMPGAAAYVGSKHFVRGFTETLRAELAGTGVAVTHVAPGPVATEFDEAAGIDGLAGGADTFMRISADACARAALAGFARGQALVFPGRAYRLAMAAQTIAPRPVQRRMARGLAARLRAAAAGDRAP